MAYLLNLGLRGFELITGELSNNSEIVTFFNF